MTCKIYLQLHALLDETDCFTMVENHRFDAVYRVVYLYFFLEINPNYAKKRTLTTFTFYPSNRCK